jgi:hypothetical protein
MNRDVCGICWALYDDEGRCECPQVKEKRMPTLREAAQQALVALNEVTGWQSLAPSCCCWGSRGELRGC